MALKFDWLISRTRADSPPHFHTDRSICYINIAASILKVIWGQCHQTATDPQGQTEKWSQGPFLWIPRGHPPPACLHPAVVETAQRENINRPHPPPPPPTPTPSYPHLPPPPPPTYTHTHTHTHTPTPYLPPPPHPPPTYRHPHTHPLPTATPISSVKNEDVVIFKNKKGYKLYLS